MLHGALRWRCGELPGLLFPSPPVGTGSRYPITPLPRGRLPLVLGQAAWARPRWMAHV